MKIGELIVELKRFKKQEGDLEIIIENHNKELVDLKEVSLLTPIDESAGLKKLIYLGD